VRLKLWCEGGEEEKEKEKEEKMKKKEREGDDGQFMREERERV